MVARFVSSHRITPRMFLLGLALGSLVLGGCRTDPSIDLLESELRQLEDKLYTLNDTVRQRDQQLDSIRRENATLRRRLGIPGTEVGIEIDPSSEEEVSLPRSSRSRRLGDDSMAQSEPPTIELGEMSETLEEAPTPAASGRGRDSLISLKEDPIPDDTEVVSIHLNPRLTGGWDMDRSPGDDGVMVVIEPRNKAGQYVPVAAPVSIVLLDPEFRGEEAYVGRWDFDTADAAKYIEKTLFGRGIHLQLPWTAGPPENTKLVLHVRYTTAEGKKLEQRKEIKVNLPGQISSRWTPAIGPLSGRLDRAALAGHTEPSEQPIPLRPKQTATSSEIPQWRPYR